MEKGLKELHGDFLEDLELGSGRSSKTVSNYDRYLNRFYTEQAVETLADITVDAVRLFRRTLRDQEASAATVNYHLIALRQFLKYLARHDVEALAPEKIALAKLGEREVDVLYPEELDGLLAAASDGVAKNKDQSRDRHLASLRDHAILQTLFSAGLRISEAVSLNRDDIRESGELPVRGKGNKVRVVFLSDEAQKAISAYVDERTDTDPALFIQHRKGAKEGENGLRITPRSVQRLIKKHAAAAGLTKKITPHTLRHSFATDLLSNGADVREVQQLLGHASITTTQVYTHLTDSHLKEVHEKYHRKRGDRGS